MSGFFFILVGIVVLQRLAELWISVRNARKMKRLGGMEVGASQYKYFVLLHSSFFIALVLEAARNGFSLPAGWFVPFIIFVLVQGIRYWCIRSLGVYWNTRIFVVPNMERVKRGPYRYFRHPNYAVVTIELAALPLIFGAWRTAVVFSILNGALLFWRISLEERALAEAAGDKG